MPDYKLSLSPELDTKLQKIAERNNLKIDELLLNAVSVYSLLKEKTMDGTAKVGILDQDNNPTSIVTLP